MLLEKMSDYFWTNYRSFQRTMSAQRTLAKATALLSDTEPLDLRSDDMETDGGNGKEKSDDSFITICMSSRDDFDKVD